MVVAGSRLACPRQHKPACQRQQRSRLHGAGVAPRGVLGAARPRWVAARATGTRGRRALATPAPVAFMPVQVVMTGSKCLDMLEKLAHVILPNQVRGHDLSL